MHSQTDFKEIYQEFQPKIHRYLTRMVGDPAAEDIAQEVFAKINRNLDGFKGQSAISTWIYRIATNTALDKLRSPSFKYSSEFITIKDLSDTEDRNVWTGRVETAVDQQLVNREMSECVREYVDNLPPDFRTVLILSQFEGFKNREIADILEISLDNVKIRLHRAKALLKKQLDNGCEFYHNEQGSLACDRKPSETR